MAQAWPWVVAGAALTVVAGRGVLSWLRRRQILDLPNERSSHTLPTPRGGGLATTPVMAVLLLAMAWQAASPLLAVLAAGSLALLAISWIDDRRGLPPGPRFLAQGAAVAIGMLTLPDPVLSGAIPLWLDHVLAGLGWLWFVNLYNFMDGIDGITGIETGTLGTGIAMVAATAAATDLVPAGLLVAAVGTAFLVFNWHPAKMFLGDSGSVPFGFVLGGLLAALAASGQLAAALILPGYYLADATITLARRAANGEKVWQAHRKHFYQRAQQGGKRHDQIALAILAANLLLLGCALVAANGIPAAGAAAAAVVVAGLLALLQYWSKKGAPT
ncbi:MAG: glycosyltransferase family 4 protein [Alphaproteobacteria bacterium]|nr:glycosyltransferase family 4 protein [Alphaproteobacteria bacterium]